MKLWLISQEVNNGYDTYSDAVVVAETLEEARNMHPSEYGGLDTWAPPTQVKVVELGEAKEGIAGVICASYHAG
jgi:hypothetical protein